MDIQQVIDDTKYHIRTQISLSSSLYRLLKEKAKQEDKSLAAIIREKLIGQLKKESEKRHASTKRLIQLTQEVKKLRESGKSGWAKVKNPHKLIRKWRQEDDEKREEMMMKTKAYGNT